LKEKGKGENKSILVAPLLNTYEKKRKRKKETNNIGRSLFFFFFSFIFLIKKFTKVAIFLLGRKHISSSFFSPKKSLVSLDRYPRELGFIITT
jgi:hypothetical protein